MTNTKFLILCGVLIICSMMIASAITTSNHEQTIEISHSIDWLARHIQSALGDENAYYRQ